MVRVHPDRQARIAEEAAMWLEKLERAVTNEESLELRKWLKTSLHREAIAERCRRWHGPEILAVLGELIPMETFAQKVERDYGRIALAIFFGVSGISLATIVIALMKLWPFTDDRQNPVREDAGFHTAIGEQKTIELPDGGSIVMNTATRLQVKYMPRSRDVILIRGEATFEVKDDPERPFVVLAGTRELKVLNGGATFNVYRVTRENTELTVMQGQIHTPESRSAVPRSSALLRARVSYGAHTFNTGEGGLLGPDWQWPRPIQRAEIDKRIAWQRGFVMLENASLEDALEEMERYSSARFRIRDDSLRDIRLSGQVDVNDTEGFRSYLRENLIHSRATSKGEIVLSQSIH